MAFAATVRRAHTYHGLIVLLLSTLKWMLEGAMIHPRQPLDDFQRPRTSGGQAFYAAAFQKVALLTSGVWSEGQVPLSRLF